MGHSVKIITKRLLPGRDVKREIRKMTRERKIHAGCVLSLVGSLKRATLRLTDGKTVKSWRRPFEIVSGTGTVSKEGCHIHIAIADGKGNVIGGHLKEGCIVNTTAEVIIASFPDLRYRRKFDKKMGYDELVVE